MEPLKAKWTQEWDEEKRQQMEPDIHIEDATKEPDRTVHDTRYAVLCGQYVIDIHIVVTLLNEDFRTYWAREPTCLGCILVNLQNRAEHG